MITAEQAQEIQARNELLDAWIDSIRGRNGWASYKPEDKPASVPDVTNEERSASEVYLFLTEKPARYFLYVNEQTANATTWTGDVLGRVSFGREFRDNFGGKRVPITVHGVNGIVYHGTYFKSSRNYARIKAAKAGSRA